MAYVIRRGYTGLAVKKMQHYLNVLRTSYPDLPVLKEDGSIDIVKGGETVKTIPAAFMTDAAGAYSADVETTLVTESDGVYMLTVTADKTWVNNAQFPVTIDPQLNDTDTVKYTVTKTQLTQNGGENLGDGVVWAGLRRDCCLARLGSCCRIHSIIHLHGDHTADPQRSGTFAETR